MTVDRIAGAGLCVIPQLAISVKHFQNSRGSSAAKAHASALPKAACVDLIVALDVGIGSSQIDWLGI